jgi:hypothetical protein
MWEGVTHEHDHLVGDLQSPRNDNAPKPVNSNVSGYRAVL